MAQYPAAVSVREVGPRDGLQNEPPVPTGGKVELLDRLSQTGVKRIEAVSFVHPRAIPQMADAAEVWEQAQHVGGVQYSALVPNVVGLRRALAAGFTDIEVVVSASTVHNQKNIARTTEESLSAMGELVSIAHEGGATVECIISTSFGCPYVGDVAPEQVGDVAAVAVAAGVDRLACGDTTGMGTPARVAAVIDAIWSRCADVPLLMHFHNTRGTALVNVLTALEMGVTEFDASVGGLGGCPYAPGASGNVATEEVVHLLHDLGVDTGIDLDALLDAAGFAQELVGHELPSGVLKAGPRTRLAH